MPWQCGMGDSAGVAGPGCDMLCTAHTGALRVGAPALGQDSAAWRGLGAVRNEGIHWLILAVKDSSEALCPSSCGAAAAPDRGLNLRGCSSAFPLCHREQLPGIQGGEPALPWGLFHESTPSQSLGLS